MDGLDLVGLRFSATKPPNATWMAHGAERGGALVVDAAEHVGATLADRLAHAVPRVLGLDAPFGVPLGLAKKLVPLATNGSQVIEQLVAAAPSALDATWATFAAEHPGALRHTDALTHGARSITSVRPPLWRTFHGVAKLLWGLRDRVAVVPFDALEIAPARSTVIEVSPGATLRLLGLPYQVRHGHDAGASATPAALSEERVTVLRDLAAAVRAYGVRLELPAHVANVCAQDAGDALDAVLALVTTHLATRGHWSPPPLTGVGAQRSLVEGWIVRPG